MDTRAAPAGSPRQPARRLARLALALCATLVVTGCTAGFLYNRIEWFVTWYVDGLVSLDDAQEQVLRDSLQRTLAWHRRTQVPRYVGLLDRLSAEAAAPVSAATFEAAYQESTVFLNDLVIQVAPDMAGLLGSLSPRQVAELGASLEEDNEELWEDFGGETPELRQKHRLKSATRTIQRFTGSLTREQRQLVERRLGAMQDLSEAWMERRRNWQRHLIELLQSPGRGPAFEARLRELLLDPNQFDTAGYRQGGDANRAVVLDMLAELSAGLSAAQREHLRDKLQEYATDLRRIAATG
jgi:hypothetical protein